VRRADVVPGTPRAHDAHAALSTRSSSTFARRGLSVRHDDPYRGGATTAHWGRPHEGFHAVQVELNRALYMDERTHERRAEPMRWLSSLCESLVARLADLPMRAS
jgi:N-formylglutamate deformylase